MDAPLPPPSAPVQAPADPHIRARRITAPAREEPAEQPEDWFGLQIERWMKQNVKAVPWRVLTWAAVAVIAAGWAGDALKGEVLFEGWSDRFVPWRPWTTSAAFLLFMVASWRVFVHRQELIGVRVPHQRPARPKRGIVFTVSPISPQGPGAQKAQRVEVHRDENGIATRVVHPRVEVEVTRRLDDDIAALDGSSWTWQQILRGLRPHLHSVKWVCLLGSAESQPDLESAKALLRAYLPDEFRPDHIRCWETPAPFDHVESMKRYFDESVEFLRQQGLTDSEIAIDVTGGYKATSVAGAMATVSTGVLFQYVHTNPHPLEDRVQECDMVHVLGHAD